MESNEPTPPPHVPTPRAPDAPAGSPPTWPGPLDASGDQWQRQTDLHHLKLLSIFYYISAGLHVLGALGSVIWIVLGIGIANAPPPQTSSGRTVEGAPEMVGGFFMMLGGCIGLFCLLWTVLNIMTGNSLNTQRRRTLCLITAGVTCLNVPLGTVLGVFTFIVLSRASVIAMFNQNRMTM